MGPTDVPQVDSLPTDTGSSGNQSPAPSTAVVVPEVLPEQAKLPSHTLPLALAEAQEVPGQRKLTVLVSAWAQSLVNQFESEKNKAEQLQQDLTNTKVSLARAEEQLTALRRRGVLETVASIFGGAILGKGISMFLEGNHAYAVSLLLMGGILVIGAYLQFPNRLQRRQ